MSDIFNPFLLISNLRDFLELGGGVLWALLILSFCIWAVAVHYWFYLTDTKTTPHNFTTLNVEKNIYTYWQTRKYISALEMPPRHFMAQLKLLVKLAPLLGLLGTVTGMVYVFEVIAISGTSNARALAEGIARATLPTMAGMAVAVLGLLFINILERKTNAFLMRIKEGL